MPRTSATPTTRRTEIFYPESDGQPLGETGTHIDVTLTTLDVLRRYYVPRRDVAILSNMFLYYVEGNPRKNVAPDLFVTLGVPANSKRGRSRSGKKARRRISFAKLLQRTPSTRISRRSSPFIVIF